jgi:hypothetical protein
MSLYDTTLHLESSHEWLYLYNTDFARRELDLESLNRRAINVEQLALRFNGLPSHAAGA